VSNAVSYNDAVRAYFKDPAHSGDLPATVGRVLSTEAVESRYGAHLQLAAGIDGDTVTAIRYRVHGCPHLIAALERFCSGIEGGPVPGLENPDFADITRELDIPVGKSGRILLLENAVASLWSQYAGTGN
jgi:NifU-like protein involved in Fe-S cluster formation